LGFELSETRLNKAFLKFKDLADKKRNFRLGFGSVANDEIQSSPEILELVQVSCGVVRPTATVTCTPDGEELTDAAIGTGPVDAVYKAINRVVNVPNQLIEFSSL